MDEEAGLGREDRLGKRSQGLGEEATYGRRGRVYEGWQDVEQKARF